MLKNKFHKILKKRAPDTHKGDYGRVLVVAGSAGMMGAAVLASRGALRSGAGLVYLGVPWELVNFINLVTPEIITLPFEKISQVKADVIAIGPGLGTSSQVKRLLANVLERQMPIVIDADALNVLAQDIALLIKKDVRGRENFILTPHPGELSRLIKKDIAYIQKNRLAVAKETAQELGCIIVLKGEKTVIAHPSGKTLVNPTGNPGMASGGVGDVLTGIIAGLAAQQITPWQSAVLGVYLHGLAGDLAAKEKGEASLIASDLIEQIPYALQKIN